tara:strand:+ start:105 stop:269 length:165 start_codon:yes stop_codon:yes gene_type:complete
MSSGIYCIPDGKGKRFCMKFEDYRKHGTDESKGWWEDAPLLIFPYCKRKVEKED